MKKLNDLIDLFKATNKNVLAIKKLQHLKTELEELEQNTPNDYILGEKIRKIIKES